MERATGAAMNHRAIGISTRYGYSQQSKAAFCPTPKTKYRDSLEYTSSNCPAKSNRGLAHSIFNLTGRGRTTRLFWRSSVSASAKVKILCNIGAYLACALGAGRNAGTRTTRRLQETPCLANLSVEEGDYTSAWICKRDGDIHDLSAGCQLDPEGCDRIDSRGAPRRKIAGSESHENERHGNAGEGGRIGSAHVE